MVVIFTKMISFTDVSCKNVNNANKGYIVQPNKCVSSNGNMLGIQAADTTDDHIV